MADSQRKTANLAPEIRSANGWVVGYLNAHNGSHNPNNHNGEWLSPKIPLTSGETITISAMSISYPSMSVYYWNGSTFMYGESANNYSGSSFTTPPNTTHIRFAIRAGRDNKTEEAVISSGFWIMMNTGSTPLPYEPYGWQHSLRKLTTATEAVENPLYSDGTAITNYTISGNTVQNGTPTPSNPVDVNGVGVRTGNLWNEAYTGISSSRSGVTYFPIYVGSGNFTLSTTARKTESPNPSQSGNANIFFLTGNVSSGAYTSGNGIWNGQSRTVTATDGYVTIAYRYLEGDSGSDPRDNDTMLNTGSTAKPYEPYGYKIPISSGQQTTNIYLGSTQTVRAISKRLYNGSEAWRLHGSLANLFYIDDYQDGYSNNAETGFAISNAFTQRPYNNVAALNNGQFVYGTPSGSATKRILMKNTACSTVEEWQTWLAENPVTVWYVLATPETTAVNEPLMKIGDYADTLSNATSIPTTEGANSITVDTTVQPSEFTATWTGWHNASVKEWGGSQWQ